MPELWQLLSGWGPHQEGSVHQAERLQGRWPWDWGRCGASGGAPSSRVGRASGRKPLPSGKGQLPVAPSLNWVGSWALSTAHPVGWGRGGGVRYALLSPGAFIGGRSTSSMVSSFKGVSPGPDLSTAHGEGKTYPRKSQLQMSPRPALPSLFPCPAVLRTPRTARRRESPSSGTARGHDTGLEG